MSAPRLTVLMPVRNGLPYLAEALDSLRAQTYADFTLLVVDDGSEDGSADFVRAQAGSLRVQVLSSDRIGFAGALNRGLEMVCTPYVARHDADDWSDPDRLRRQLAFLDRHPDVGVVGACASFIDARGEPVANDWTATVRAQQDVATTHDAIRALMPLTCCLTHGSVMARREVFDAAGGYDGELAPAEDYDLWLRILNSWRFAKLPEPLYAYRVHGGQWSAAAREAQLLNTIRAKLRFVRATHPWLPTPAVLSIADETRGSPAYRRVAPELAFTERPAGAPANRTDVRHVATALAADTGWNLLVVTDFAALPAYVGALALGLRQGRVLQEGNMFLRWPGAVV